MSRNQGVAFCFWGLLSVVLTLLGCLGSGATARSCSSKNAYVTLAADDVTSIGAITLRESLVASKTKNCIVVMVTDGISWLFRDFLETQFDDVVRVKSVAVRNLIHPSSAVFGKIWVWSLTRYKKIVYLHFDTIVLKNVDELFEYPQLSAVPLGTWTDLFDPGVLVLEPNNQTSQELLKLAKQEGSFDETDQGILNTYFYKWNHISYVYNTDGNSPEIHPAAFHRFGSRVKIARFASDMKPWFVSYNTRDRQTEMYAGELGLISVPRPLYERWWHVFIKRVKPRLNRMLLSHNMEIFEDGHRIYIGDPVSGLHVGAGFFTLYDKSYPKFRTVNGHQVNNQYCTIQDLFFRVSENALDAKG